MPKTKRLVQWFGANTENAQKAGRLLDGCRFVGIPFGGGMSEVPYIAARQILVSDVHRHIINLCRCVQDEDDREWLIRKADSLPYHPDVLDSYQHIAECDFDSRSPNLPAALAYFVCVWMGRGGKAGTHSEFSGELPVRWGATGGGSNRRYRTAIEGLHAWGEAFRRCDFVCMDAFDFLQRFVDRRVHGLFVDAPWPDAGDEYLHGFAEADQRRLAEMLATFQHARVIIRYGEHPLIRELYTGWSWIKMESRTQANTRQREYLIARNLPTEVQP